MKAWLNGAIVGLVVSAILGVVASIGVCWSYSPGGQCSSAPFNWSLFSSFILAGILIGLLIGYFVGKRKSK